MKDTRIRCPHCGITTWMTDYTRFMRDHNRPDGRVCRAAQKEEKSVRNHPDLLRTP